MPKENKDRGTKAVAEEAFQQLKGKAYSSQLINVEGLTILELGVQEQVLGLMAALNYQQALIATLTQRIADMERAARHKK